MGNSFSEDAFYYLHDLAECDGINLQAVNLYIGGCPLERHWNNITSEAREYLYELNSQSTEKYVSVNEVLQNEFWDYIITQQASHDSGIRDIYFLYINQVVNYFLECCLDAECFIQKTRAYEIDSTHEMFGRYHNNQKEMYECLSECYRYASEKTGLLLIQSANVIQHVRSKKPFRYELGEKSLCRDGFHMDMIYGRYLLAATVYKIVLHKDITKNSFISMGADEDIIEIIKKGICEVLG